MKTATVLALATSTLLMTLPPVSAADIEDTVRANCTKELVASTDATRAELKTFRIVKIGSGYEMSGVIDSGQTVKCRTNADGRVIAVSS